MDLAEVYTDFDESSYFDGLDSYESYISEQLASAMTQADKLRPHLNELHTVRSYYDLMMMAKPIVALLLDFETARVRFVSAGIAAGDDKMLVKNRELLNVYEDISLGIESPRSTHDSIVDGVFQKPPITTLYDYL